MSRFRTTSQRLVLGAVAALAASTMLVGIAAAQSPPTPPSRFVGSVRVDGANAPAGTAIEARIGSTTCGVSTVFMSGSEARYALDSPALEPSANPNCGVDGSVVTFFVGGRQAAETGSWANYRLNTVNLTVSGAATPAATPTRTPGAPSAGSSVASNEGSAPPVMEFLLVASALGLAGVGIATRIRKP